MALLPRRDGASDLQASDTFSEGDRLAMGGEPDTTSMEGWLAAAAELLGREPPTRAEIAALLDLARHAAHRSQRQAAPIACWLAGRSGLTADEALALVAADPRLRALEEESPG